MGLVGANQFFGEGPKGTPATLQPDTSEAWTLSTAPEDLMMTSFGTERARRLAGACKGVEGDADAWMKVFLMSMLRQACLGTPAAD